MTRRRQQSPRNDGRGFRRGPRIADRMTREYHAFLASSLAAERAGDAAAALEYHRGIPMFTRSAHTVVLTQLAALSDEMTPWLWARWAAYQCTRAEDPGTESQRIQRFALDYTMRMFYDDEMAAAFDAGDDPVRILARVMGEDWVCHQICTFELGGLRAFLDELVTGRLAEEAELAREWVGARMSGYRVEPTGAGQLVVRDLASRESHELLDLGGRGHADAHGYLIGRLVPTGTTPGLMFDTRPVGVDEQTAREVAATTRGGWITPLMRAIKDRRLDRAVLKSENRELITDVPSLAMLEIGTRPAERERVLRQLHDGRDEVGRAAYRILVAVAEDRFGPDDLAPYVAAAVLNAHAYAEATSQVVAVGQQERWARWTALVPAPARGRLERLAEQSSHRAA